MCVFLRRTVSLIALLCLWGADAASEKSDPGDALEHIKNHVRRIRVPKGLIREAKEVAERLREEEEDEYTNWKGGSYLNPDELEKWAMQLLKENNIHADYDSVRTTLLVKNWEPEDDLPNGRRFHRDGYGPSGSDCSLEKLILVYVTLANHTQGTAVSASRVDNNRLLPGSELFWTLSGVEGQAVAIDNRHVFHAVPRVEAIDTAEPVMRVIFRIILSTDRFNAPRPIKDTTGTVDMGDLPIGKLTPTRKKK